MKILVPIKRVVDAYVTVRVKADESGVETANVKMSMNPFCEIAIEEAVRLKEAGTATEVVAVSAGPQKTQETLRTALAMGADRAIHIHTEETLQPLIIARLLKAVSEKEAPDLILAGKQAVDGDNNQVAQMLAGMLNWPQATFAFKIDLDTAANKATVIREVDGGLETLETNLPAVITADLRLNEPRFASLPNIMKAKKKPLDTLTPEDLGITVEETFKVLKVTEPPKRAAGIKVEDVDQLIDKLRNEARVLS